MENQQDKSQEQQQQQQNSGGEYKDGENNYQLMQEQINNIQKEIQETQPIVSEPLPLSTLEPEFLQNEIFLLKIQNIKTRYPTFRKIRGDGQCFYRSYLFGIFEKIVSKKDQNLFDKMHKLVKDSKEYLVKAGFEEYVLEDFQELFLEKLELAIKEDTNMEKIMNEVFLDQGVAFGLVMYFRFMTSGYLKTNAILFENYIFDYQGIDHYCQTEVDPIDREADQITMMALISYVEIPIRIVYLDQNMQYINGQEMFIPEDSKPEDVYINMLYRPGHYDLLYSQQ